jgi:general secretion pathway protein A
MSYIAYLDLQREPFASNADPFFLYTTERVSAVLDGLEIAVLLRRGACVCLGGPGMGKTMLCHALTRRLQANDQVAVFPLFSALTGNVLDFVTALQGCIVGREAASQGNSQSSTQNSVQGVLESIKTHIQERVQRREDENLVLILDEAQRLSPACLEVLRDLLNLENASGKLLQIVIFAQPGFQRLLDKHPSFAARLSERYSLQPWSRAETADMITHRLYQAGESRPLFSNAAISVIHAASQGVPRNIIHLAHKSLLSLVAQNREKVGYFLARSRAREQGWRPRVFSRLGLALIALLSLLTLATATGLDPLLQRFAPTSLISSPEMPPGTLRSPVVAQYRLVQESLDAPKPEQANVPDELQREGETVQNATDTLSDQPGAQQSDRESDRQSPQDSPRSEGLAVNPPALGAEQAETPTQPKGEHQDDVRYIVQIGAFAHFAKANELYQEFAPDFEEAGMRVVEFKGRNVHVVYLAEFATAYEAFRLLRDVKRNYGIEVFVIEMSARGYHPLYAETVRGE